MFPFKVPSVVCGDCAELMKQMPNESVDLVVTSPPYDGLRLYEGYKFDFYSVALQLVRVLKVGGVIVWVVADETKDGSESGTSFKQALYFMAKGLNLHDTMIYQRSSPPLTHNRYEQHFEYMFVFSKGAPKTFHPLKAKKEWKDNRKTKTIRREKDGSSDKGFVGKSDEKIIGNVWHISAGGGHSAKDNFAHEHPAIFPEELATKHILSWSNPGDLVFDPMCGSGTTLKMAKILERQYLGFDISPKYTKLAQRRLMSVPEVMPLQTLAASNKACTRLGEGSRQKSLFPTDSNPVIGDESKPAPSG